MLQVSLKSRMANLIRIVSGSLSRKIPSIRGAGVLLYHGVAPEISNPLLEQYTLPEDAFVAQLKFLKKHFECIHLDELLHALKEGEAINPKSFVITFDDAIRSQFDFAAPILADMNLPWALSVPTALIGTERCIWTYELAMNVCLSQGEGLVSPNGQIHCGLKASAQKRQFLSSVKEELMVRRSACERKAYMDQIYHESVKTLLEEDREGFLSRFKMLSWDELRSLKEHGVHLMSHSATHQPINHTLNDEQLNTEIVGSFQTLKERMGLEQLGFALPGGVCEKRGMDAVQNAGYDYLFTSHTGRVKSDTALFELPRINGEYPVGIFKQHFINS